MLKGLNDRVFIAGASIQARFEFRRSDPTDDLLNSLIELKLFKDKALVLNLLIGSGLERTINQADLQSIKVTITPTQVSTLLGTAQRVRINYVFAIAPASSELARGDDASLYSGAFYIIAENQGGLNDS